MKYIITSAQKGATLNKNFWQNILKFKEVHNVDKIFLFVMTGRYKTDEVLHPSVATLPEIEIVNSYEALHEKVQAYDSKVLPQRVKPTLGLSDKLPMERSYVLPATKVRWDSISSLGTKPRFFTTTGSVTRPFYKLNTNQGVKAQEEHQYGFVFFESLNKREMLIRNIPADKSGNFYHLRHRFHNGLVTEGDYIECLNLGDWHTGQTNKIIRKKTIELIDWLKPKYVVFHDFFDGYSINHHNRKNLLDRVRSSNRNKDSLEDELKLVYKEMMFFAKKFPKVKFLIPESNHDVFITSWIDKKFWVDEYHNTLIGAKILPQLIDLRNVALEESLKLIGKMPENFKFFRENSTFRIRGWEVSQHGHKGSNGSRGSNNQFKRLNVKMMKGHDHTPFIGSNVISVGSSTNLEQDYTIGGPSSWGHAHGIIYPNGTATLYTMTARQPVVR